MKQVEVAFKSEIGGVVEIRVINWSIVYLAIWTRGFRSVINLLLAGCDTRIITISMV